MAGYKLCEFGGPLSETIPSQARKGRCNDYPEREYTQVSGSAQHPATGDEIVSSAWRHAAAERRAQPNALG